VTAAPADVQDPGGETTARVRAPGNDAAAPRQSGSTGGATVPAGVPQADRVVLAAAGVLVATVAVLAFLVSFDAISTYAIQTGAFPPGLGWAAPLLVDTFTVAATLVVYARSLARVRAPFAWAYVAASTLTSLALNVAHAPDRLDARLLAALPPLAQLAAIELLMSEARRLTRRPLAPPVMPVESAGTRGDDEGAEPAAGPATTERGSVSTRERIAQLLVNAEARGTTVTGLEAAAATGVSVRRAQQLLQALKATGPPATYRRPPDMPGLRAEPTAELRPATSTRGSA